MSDNIKVVVKVRPLISREIEDKLSYQWRVRNNTLHQIDQNGKDLATCFTFDKVYDKDTDTSEVYNDVAKPIVEAAITGFNGTIFAYGQTSSGKTYTMSGTDESPGIIPRAVIHLFDRIKQIPDRDFLVRVSYIEIYNETLRDLLNIEKKNVKVHETLQGVKVDVDERVTSSPEEVLEAMREGEANRQTGATNMNEESSRSHSIFQITIASREHVEDEEEVGCVNVSQLNLVDLAGSERSGQTGATGIRFKEGTHINKSLSVLARVIKQLSEMGTNVGYINYRDSKLTRILQNSLGGNAKTSIICAITPASVEETISTLQFANRAKAIQNKPEVNAVATAATTSPAMIQSLTKQLSKLQAQLDDKRNLEQDNANLQNKIANLQKWILNGMFVQNSSMDSTSQTRRKKTLQQLRRVTISTLHPINEADDSSPTVPKFCTPSLKYNPLSMSASEFLPIPSCSKLSLGPLPEEERMVTPPPPGETKAGGDDVINLDDSDEIASGLKTCSPYHKCYSRSQTPPCVLRNNALAAEKSLQEIIDLTKREKMYTPNTVEMLEKLEQNCTTITKLEEELMILKEQSKEKDTEIEELRNKITNTEEEVKTIADAKSTLESQCKEFSAKITDWEVSYETLQNKSKRREEELLLLLDEEKSSKKCEDIRKSVSRELNFMDISKDISLVNSDTENSIITNPHELESSEQIKELVAELQAQLNAKNDAIFKLESNLYAEKQKIENLESSIHDLQSVIDGFNSKYPRLETENLYLQSTIDTLNSTIEKQKSCLEVTNKDIESYNSTIQELQIKLCKKETLPNIKLNDNLLETMIINEEKLIANNENVRNIIKSFKLALDSRNKEIDVLKSQIDDSTETKSKIDSFRDEIEIKEKHINTLMEQIDKLKEQLTENVDMINRLLANEKELSTKLVGAQDLNDSLRKQNEENTVQTHSLQRKNIELTNNVQELNRQLEDVQNQLREQSEENLSQVRDLDEANVKLTNVIDQLNAELAKTHNQNDSLKKQNEELVSQINYLEDLNTKLSSTIAEKEAFEQEIKAKHSILSQEYDNMSQKISDLEKEINLKHEEISIINVFDKQTQEFYVKLKLVLIKMQDVIFILSNTIWDVPDDFDGLGTVFNVLDAGMHHLQTAVKQILEERNRVMEDNKTIAQELSVLEEKYKTDNSSSRHAIEMLQNSKDETEKLNAELLSQINSLQRNLNTLQKEIEANNHNISILERHQNEINSNENIVFTLKENISVLEAEVKLLSLANKKVKDDLTQEQNDLTKVLEEKKEEFEEILKTKDEAISNLNNKITELEKDLDKKNQEVTTVILEVNKVKENNITELSDVLYKVTELSRHFNVEHYLPSEFNDDGENLHKKIIFALDQVSLSISNLADQTNLIEEKQGKLVEILKTKDEAISDLNSRLIEVEKDLDKKHHQFTTVMLEVNKVRENEISVLSDVLDKVLKLSRDFGVDNYLPFEFEDGGESLHKKIVFAIDHVSLCISDKKYGNEIERVYDDNEVENNEFTQARKDERTEMNVHYLQELAPMDHKSLVTENQSMEDLNESLTETTELLNKLKVELSAKAEEILTMEKKTSQWKDQFKDLQEQILQLQLENNMLRNRESIEHAKTKSPPSLVSICFSHIIDALQLNSQVKSVSTTSSKSSICSQDAQAQVKICDCVDMTLILDNISEDNIKLMERIKQLESVNEALISEQEEIRREVQLLVEPAQQLQKKVVNHRTNLSTLMATTYAEYKLLQSQLKVTKHHHARYINVCQRDIPYFKTQLLELMMILKDNESYLDRHNVSFKRYSLPDVLDNNPPSATFKNESTLDGDLLMLDTNVTLASAESTLLGYDQTCLDNTEMNLDDELADTSKAIGLYTQTEWLKNYDKKILETVQNLKLENQRLREQNSKFLLNSDSSVKIESRSNSDTSFSISSTNGSKIPADTNIRQNCSDKSQNNREDSRLYQERFSEIINRLEQDLENMKLQKNYIEKKYSELSLEIPTTEALVKKINGLEEENKQKLQQITKINNEMSKKAELIKELQEENDQLSTQVIESISEVDDLKKELDKMNELISSLNDIEKGNKDPETEAKTITCSQCLLKDELLKAMKAESTNPLLMNRSLCDTERKQNRSHSDSESTSRLNKICTLQNEILESKEDCKKISEDVITVKNSLERSGFSMSMDLDDSMTDKNIFCLTEEIPKAASNIISDVEHTSSDLYTVDKMECLKYYIEKTGDGKENLSSDFKLIDVLKSFYNNLISKHSEEVENFVNKIRDFEDAKALLKTQINNVSMECEKLTKEIEAKDNYMKAINEVRDSIKTNTDFISLQMCNIENENNDKKILTLFKDNLLKVLDEEFNISSSNIFDSLINNMANKHQKDLEDIMKRYEAIKTHMVSVETEVNSVNENLMQMKSQLAEKEQENDLLKAQKEKIQEISKAVTLDIVKKEQEIHNLIKTGYEQLVDFNDFAEIDLGLSVDASIKLLFQKVKDLHKQDGSKIKTEKESLTSDVNKLKDALQQTELELASLKDTLLEKEKALSNEISKNNDLEKAFQKNMEEVCQPLKHLERTTELKMKELLELFSEKHQSILLLQNKVKQHANSKLKSAEILLKIEELSKENEGLKCINAMITEEKQQVDIELQKSKELIHKNKVDLDKLTADILVLRETVTDNVSVIESLTMEAKALHEQNEILKKKAQECARLEMFIKTHEKTAEIQTKMINRLKTQKEESDEAVKEKDKRLDELTLKCIDLEKQYEEVLETVKASKEEIERLTNIKKHLEERVSQLEMEVESGQKRFSIEAIGDHSRRRRQSLHDSRRLADGDRLEFQDHTKLEAMFESRAKPDDLFMEVDGDSGHSNRSTPLRLSRGRESLVRPDSDEDPQSRPSSVLAIRRRRQSIHDLHRSALGHTPSPHEHPRIIETHHDACDTSDSSTTQLTSTNELHDRLVSTQKELEELKEKYRELDEECEICAQYLRERDAQCVALKKEKRELEQQVAELNARLKSNPNSSQDLRSQFSDASVNTDEDWANLHSVVVDRMSFDAEVEKNKKLTRTIEELRYKNQDLKKSVQQLMEKLSNTKENRELETLKSELSACREELEELRERYRELDEECETCAEYLRERDEQCRRLAEAKAALEAKLLEYEEKDVSNIAQSVKKKRQSMHDQNRPQSADNTDATTETTDDLLSNQVERDSNSRNESAAMAAAQEWEQKYKQSRRALDKLIMEKTALEHKLMAFHPTTYVATGSAIVQSQQLTDVMKENQKLKRINAKLVEVCKKRGKSLESRSRDNRENEDPVQRDLD